jgi:hypothetical protein
MPKPRARITDNNPLSRTDGVIDSYKQVNQSGSQEVDLNRNERQVNKSASQLTDQPTSQPVNKLTSPLADQSASQPVSQQASSSTLPEGGEPSELNNPEAEIINQSASQQADKLVLRKATFKLDSEVLAALDRYHLQLQLDLGKQAAPYKETIVEEAIAQWLERSEKSPERTVKSLSKRQERR